MPRFRTGIGQDSHAFLTKMSEKKCVVAGLSFDDVPGMDADSDGDVVFHSICNAITTLTHVPILGKIAIDLCHNQGITDSCVYLKKALETLMDQTIQHVALSIEGKRPKFQYRCDEIRTSVAAAMNLDVDQVGITFTSGDGLTSFGRGEGLFCTCVISTFQP